MSDNKNQINPANYWFTCHLRALMFGLGELLRKPFSSFMTILVIAIALALPIGLFSLLQNAETVSKNFDGTPTLSLYLKQDLAEPQLVILKNELNKFNSIDKIQYISADAGLKEFETEAQIGNISQLLQQNPLPAVIIITPTLAAQTPEQMQALADQLKNLPEVTNIQFDVNWVKRLYYIIQSAERLALLLGVLFGIGVILIIGNTIRLATQSHRDEINILKLIGATSAFIRRPLLYRGFLYGFIGGLFSLILISLMFWWLKEPLFMLAESYQLDIQLSGLTLIQMIIILLIASLFGLAGSWIAVQKHLFTEETV